MLYFWALALSGFTSAFNCVALQMGLLGSVIAAKKGGRGVFAIWATGAFLLAKLLGYVGLGFLLGLSGQAFSVSEEVAAYIELAAGLYVVLAALAILDVHPTLRYLLFQPPRFVGKLLKSQSQHQDLLAPALLGLMMLLIPCGTTVGVEALALESGNPFTGAAILGAFTLGTIPVFVAFGSLVALIGEKFVKRFDKISAGIILILGLIALNETLGELGFPYTLELFGGME